MNKSLTTSLWQQFNQVLLLDKDAVLLSMLKDILDDEGFRSTISQNLEEAIRMMETGQYSVVIIDPFILQSDMSLLKKITNMKDFVKTIFYASESSPSILKEGLNHGIYAFVEKFGDPEELVQFILKALQEKIFTHLKIMEQKKPHNELSDNQFDHIGKAFLQTTKTGIFVERERRCLFTNRAAANILGLEKEKLFDKGFHQILLFDSATSEKSAQTEEVVFEGSVIQPSGNPIYIRVERKEIEILKKPSHIYFIHDLDELERMSCKRKKLHDENTILMNRLDINRNFSLAALDASIRPNAKKGVLIETIEVIQELLELEERPVVEEELDLSKLAKEMNKEIDISFSGTHSLFSCDRYLMKQILIYFSLLVKRSPVLITCASEKKITLQKESPHLSEEEKRCSASIALIRKFINMQSCEQRWEELEDDLVVHIYRRKY